MTCPSDTTTVHLRSPVRPDGIQPDDLVFVRVGDTLYLEGTEPAGVIQFWRVCRPDQPTETTTTTTTTTSSTTTTEPVTTTTWAPPPVVPHNPTTTTTEPATTTTRPPHGPVHCEQDGWTYDGTDTAVCQQPDHLPETGIDLGPPTVAGVLLITAGLLITFGRRNRPQRGDTQ